MAYIGYISDGKVRVKSTVLKTKMDEHVWLDEDFEEESEGEIIEPTRVEIGYYIARDYIIAQKGAAYWNTTAPYHMVTLGTSNINVLCFKSQPQEVIDYDSTSAPYVIWNIDTFLRVFDSGSVRLETYTGITTGSFDGIAWSNFDVYYKGSIVSAAQEPLRDPNKQHISNDGSAISLAFNGTMETGVDGKIEFVTETKPWVFWTNGNSLYGKKLGSTLDPVNLAVNNCTDVSAVSVTDSSVGGFDFGLIVFFVLAGSVYYRQLIAGSWMDAVPVSAAPSDVVKIAAFRTWDHRVGVQMQTSDGKVHELYTQYMGIGKHNEEHVDVRNIAATGKYTAIAYHDTSAQENVHIAEILTTGSMLYGLSSIPVSARNVDDGEGDYGRFVEITFDRPVTNVENHSNYFTMVDLTSGIQYVCLASHSSNDGLTITLEFMDFNLSQDNDLKICYAPGNIQCIVAKLAAFEYSFTPENLIRPDIPIPEPLSAINLDSSGVEIELTFSQKVLMFNLDANVEHFKINMWQYDFVPGGALTKTTRTVKALKAGATDDILVITLASGSTRSIRNAVGEVSIVYSGGTIYGEGGPVSEFELSFTPIGLNSKNNPNAAEYVEIGDVSAHGVLSKIKYNNTLNEENVKIGEVIAIGALTHIDDL